MRRADFEKELRRMATLTRLPLNPPAVIEFAYAHEPAPDFQNVFKGAGRKAFLLVTAEATYAIRLGRLRRRRLRPDWIVRHSSLVGDAYYARETRRRQIVDALVLPLDNGTKVFAMGAGAGLAQYNCEMAAWEINEVRGASRSGVEPIDPFAPQRAGAQALTAYQAKEYSLAFLLYVEAIDRLHEVFVAGECRARRPSAGDEGLLDGLVAAFRAARHAAPANQPLPDDVEAAFAHVVAQLREIAEALDPPSRTPYNTAIRRLLSGTTSGK
jgi:hypothetical protein